MRHFSFRVCAFLSVAEVVKTFDSPPVLPETLDEFRYGKLPPTCGALGFAGVVWVAAFESGTQQLDGVVGSVSGDGDQQIIGPKQ
ncbi:hypothetical protein GCM10023156_22870 [Novipirellula rosea]|uniref:Uncharacterized protein n=1 Tax=Novipirellula rosea TaxID=1031540 RepID=A0ABP8MMG2_9BACT